MTTRKIVLALALLGLTEASRVAACNVPVFRYALERWVPDPYQVVVFHEGPLAPGAQKVVTALLDYVDRPDGCPTNLTFEVVDVSKNIDRRWQDIIQTRKDATLPWLSVRYPAQTEIKASLHEGPLDTAFLQSLLDSPMRRTLAERLLSGQTAVWILVESGDKDKDNEKAAWLTSHLKKLEQTLTLPELTTAPKDKLRADLALKIEFSLLRVSRQDAREQVLVRCLLGMEDDLEPRREPIVFPVFGRGLALWAIVGKGINADNIEGAARFLVSACSCEVKAQNPGVDLLMTADWEKGLSGQLTKAPDVPALTSLIPDETFATPEGQSVQASVVSEERKERTNSVLWRNIVLVFGAGLLVLIVGSMLVFARKK